MENNENAGFAGQAAEKASQFAGQAKDLLSKVDTEKAMGATNKFMAGIFKFGKFVSAIFMMLCILTMAGSLLYAMFAGPDSLEIPEFADLTDVHDDSGDGESSGAEELASKQEYRKVRDAFSKKIDTIVDLYNLDAKDSSEALLQHLCEVPESYRKAYVNGAISFGKDGVKYYAKQNKGSKVTSGELWFYDNFFKEALEEMEESRMEARLNRQAAWTVCGGAFLGLILFLFLPLLIQIEENTRK